MKANFVPDLPAPLRILSCLNCQNSAARQSLS